MPQVRTLPLYIALLAAVAVAVGLPLGNPYLWQPSAVVATVALAIGLRFVPSLRGYQFTAWILAAVTAAMLYPASFLKWGDFDLRNKWAILLIVQAVMFGMGTQMKLKDFAGVMKMPWGVLVGLLCQFTIMPLVGLTLTKIFAFPPEIAAGVILIGSCSSGLASNVMAYIARANLALSITVTSITTLIAPLMTPFWMKFLAGAMVDVSFLNMMVEIIKIVLVPVGAALLHDYLNHASPRGRRAVLVLASLASVWLVFVAIGGWGFLSAHFGGNALVVLGLFGFVMAAIVGGVLYHQITKFIPKLDALMPIASMFGIVYFTTVTTAAGRDDLLKVGALLFVAAVLHNGAGYFLGYWFSRGLGLDKNSARAIAFEVGLQNGGMASGLAGTMGKLGTVGLASAIFSPWMNVSGSLLANYWKRTSRKAGSTGD